VWSSNLSGESVGTGSDLLVLIEAELKAAGVEPCDIVFEITETGLMHNLEAGAQFARGLADLGCGIALDDFGTGYGSFNYLKHLPIGYLKIDTDFVRDLNTNSANQHLVKAIVSLAQAFGQQTIAEGVEDAQTLALLHNYGVDFAQGFHLGRPAPTRRSIKRREQTQWSQTVRTCDSRAMRPVPRPRPPRRARFRVGDRAAHYAQPGGCGTIRAMFEEGGVVLPVDALVPCRGDYGLAGYDTTGFARLSAGPGAG